MRVGTNVRSVDGSKMVATLGCLAKLGGRFRFETKVSVFIVRSDRWIAISSLGVVGTRVE